MLITAALAAYAEEPAPPVPPVGHAVQPTSKGQALAGQRFFDMALSGTNGRACASCHPESEHTTLRPASVAARLAQNPGDPLFNAIDADDPGASTLTYEHMKRGLIRITLPLPDNMDLLDSAGNVITPPDRTVSVWRGVPSVANVSYTAPFQFDGREATLQELALSALKTHSQLSHAMGPGKLDLIAAYASSIFSSNRAAQVAAQVAAGVPISSIQSPEDGMPLTAAQARGKAVFQTVCARCHGGATGNVIPDRAVLDSFFFELDHNGNVVYEVTPDGPVPVVNTPPDNNFMALGVTTLTYLGQIGARQGLLTNEVEMPRIRLRFYTDGTRTTQVTDLPPIPVTASGDPFDLNPAIDPATGAPITGPDFVPQWWSTDPGRCLISGSPRDFESFDIPQLRGVAHTAPYFHDNSHSTLAQVINTYSRSILPNVPTLNMPAIHPPEAPGLPAEALSQQQKADLLAFLAVY
ncbi:cytochrome-c peroxidase [Pyxidicoccus parkwayensis]|uniref:Cytochrome-c peroxidase n=2 Tax=Pyxidicoccus parkwayensis TaxID=2813578 RepID=A0ABX7PE16_9BACT|nr:cytochrome-c peroxidase [Pyxidicoccus parkwaysis]